MIEVKLTIVQMHVEEKAREWKSGPVSGRQHGFQLRRLAEHWAQSQLGEGFTLSQEFDGGAATSSLLFKHEEAETFVRLLIFGPYKDVDEYSARLNSFMAQLVSTAAAADKVIGLVPYPSREYWNYLDLQAVSCSNIEIFVVHFAKDVFEPIKLERAASR
ncbi:hypothetical protein [Bradyrhizobium sp.]|uniref:hypothetical protein n=1 Tax=Bradyrhizobium sp. TaxID=376 RepID=UPI002634FB64|nr:hypothetical protein [Bradyrhizobium sp.]